MVYYLLPLIIKLIRKEAFFNLTIRKLTCPIFEVEKVINYLLFFRNLIS